MKTLIFYLLFTVVLWVGGFLGETIAQEDISHLNVVQGILEKTDSVKFSTYYIKNENGYVVRPLHFGLWCRDPSIRDQYIGKNIRIWHFNNVVYQVEHEQTVLCDLEMANKKVFVYNLRCAIGTKLVLITIYLITFIYGVKEEYKEDAK